MRCTVLGKFSLCGDIGTRENSTEFKMQQVLNQPSQMPSAQQRNTDMRWLLIGLVLPLMIYVARATPIVADGFLWFDTEYTYLPLARRLLQDSTSFWNSPDILAAAPGIFVYMALAHADVVTIQTFNLTLALTSVILLFDATRRSFGFVAASVAAWLCACSPVLVLISIWLMAEPPYLFLVALWLWASACCMDRHAGKVLAWISPMLAGLALGMATLTRATYMYWIPSAIVALCILAISARWRHLLPWKKLLLAHVIALICIGAYMAANAQKFHKLTIANGAGAALFFGINPMLRGQEPPYFGLAHSSPTQMSHLSIEGDSILTQAHRKIASSLPLASLFKTHLDKAATFLFFSKSHLRNYSERAWRIFLLVLAICGAWLGRHKPMTWLLAGVLIYQWAVHIPVLYNQRYSVSALDTGLTLLAAAGAGMLWSLPRRKLFISCTVVIIVASVLGGAWHQRYSPPALPQVNDAPQQLMRSAALDEIMFDGLQGNPFQETAAIASGNVFSVTWRAQFSALDGSKLVRLRVQEMHGRCSQAWLTHTSQQGEEKTTHIRLRGWRGEPDFAWGLNNMQHATPSTQLRIKFECSTDTSVRFSAMELHEASLGQWLNSLSAHTEQ